MTIEKTEHPDSAERFAAALRIPGWCRSWKITVNGKEAEGSLKDGYLYLERDWKDQDVIRLECSMEAERNYANPMVKYDIGKTAVTRGPFVYCLEEADNGKGLTRICLPSGNLFKTAAGEVEQGELDLETDGVQILAAGWEDSLYGVRKPTEYEQKHLRFVPYYLWNNRGIGEMTVWIHETDPILD